MPKTEQEQMEVADQGTETNSTDEFKTKVAFTNEDIHKLIELLVFLLKELKFLKRI